MTREARTVRHNSQLHPTLAALARVSSKSCYPDEGIMTSAKEGALTIRPLREDDATVISEAFAAIGWTKPVEQYVRYSTEQHEGLRDCWVALVDGRFAGYVTLKWNPDYPGLAGLGVPEIQDLNVLPDLRRRGIASRLLDCAEEAAGRRARVVGIGGRAPSGLQRRAAPLRQAWLCTRCPRRHLQGSVRD